MENDMETVTIQWLWRGLSDKNRVLAYNSPAIWVNLLMVSRE